MRPTHHFLIHVSLAAAYVGATVTAVLDGAIGHALCSAIVAIIYIASGLLPGSGGHHDAARSHSDSSRDV